MSIDAGLDRVQALAAAQPDAARAVAQAFLAVDDCLPRDHHAWARACERLDLLDLAVREWQLALQRCPDDATAAAQLATLLQEQGDVESARAALAAARIAGPTDDTLDELLSALNSRRSADDASEPSVAVSRATEPAAASDADLARFLALFAGREDAHARQWCADDGRVGYAPVREPLTPRRLRAHLAGDETLGAYVVRLDGSTGFFVIDLDIRARALDAVKADLAAARRLREKVAAAALDILAKLHALGLPVLLEDSGNKGRHLWVFLRKPEAAADVHEFGQGLVQWLGSSLDADLSLEFFPKQGTMRGQGLGNLIKLPLGRHRKTGRWSVLLDARGQAIAEPLVALRAQPQATAAQLHEAMRSVHALAGAVPAPPTDDAPEPVAPALPAAPAVPDAWTDADFDTDPQVSALLRGCPVLAELRRKVAEHGLLTYDEQMVVTHVLGHAERGVLAVNHLLRRAGDVPAERLLKSRLAGQPTSCARIRQRVAQVASKVACNCAFPSAAGRYASPVLHSAEPIGSAPTGAHGTTASSGEVRHDLPSLARTWAQLERRRQDIEQQCGELRERLLAALAADPGASLPLSDGVLDIVEEAGVRALRWTPAGTQGAERPEAEEPGP